MENEAKKSSFPRWLSGFFVAGLIWSPAQQFNKSSLDEFIIAVVAIGAGYFYHPLKRKIKISNEAGRVITTFLILFVASAFLIGACTGVANRLSSSPTNDDAMVSSTSYGAEFTQNIVQGCMEQSADPKFAKFSVESLNNYCTCVAKEVADQTTVHEVKLLSQADNAEIKSVLATRTVAAANSCAKTVFGL